MGSWSGYLSNPSLQNGITAREFVALGLADRAPGEARQFVGALGAAQLAVILSRRCVAPRLTTNRPEFFDTLRNDGIGVPRIQAAMNCDVAGADVRVLTRFADLRAFLANEAAFPIRAVPASQELDRQAQVITGFRAKAGRVLTSTGAMPLKALAAEFDGWGGAGVLFLAEPEVHPEFGDLSAVLRVVSFCHGDRVEILGSYLSVDCQTGAGPIELLGSVEHDTGAVGTVVDPQALGGEAGSIAESFGAELTGFPIPGWAKIRADVTRAARLLRDVPLIGWDVAVTPDGPLVMGADPRPTLDVLQYLSGTGLLANPMIAQAWDQRFAKVQRARGTRVARRLGLGSADQAA